jgi:hypothetical protein
MVTLGLAREGTGRMVGNSYLGITSRLPFIRRHPNLCGSMQIEHYVHVKIPETILTGGGSSGSGCSGQAAY